MEHTIELWLTEDLGVQGLGRLVGTDDCMTRCPVSTVGPYSNSMLFG